MSTLLVYTVLYEQMLVYLSGRIRKKNEINKPKKKCDRNVTKHIYI